MVSKEAYPDYDAFFADIAAAWRKAIRAFYDAGCRYLQLDDTAWAMMCDPKEREESKSRGDDPDSLPAIYARVTNAALEGKPADMAITMHSCRGNFLSTFIAQAATNSSPSICSRNTNLDGYFLEYDSDRAGGFEPLRFFPRARSNWCSAWSPEERAAGADATRSSAASRRPPNMSRSTNFACRRNAASPPPRKATCWPRTSSGPSCV